MIWRVLMLLQRRRYAKRCQCLQNLSPSTLLQLHRVVGWLQQGDSLLGSALLALRRKSHHRSRKSRAVVEEIAKELRVAGFKAEGVVKKGKVRETILENATEWEADLIVLGSHGRKGVKRFLLGSVAESVARHAPCSVEIVRLLQPEH